MMEPSAPHLSERPPRSATANAVNIAGYSAAAATALVLGMRAVDPLVAGLATLAVAATIMIGGDLVFLKVHRRVDAGLGAGRAFDARRVTIKLFGFVATLALVAIAYALLLPLAGAKFLLFSRLFAAGLVVTLVVAPIYFAALDGRMQKPEDGYWEVGQLLLGRFSGRDWPAVRTHALGWIVKGFFLPIMAAAFISVGGSLNARLAAGAIPDAISLFRISFDLILLTDLAVAVLGYVFTLRLLDTHIRSCNPLWYGWVVTLVCYYPFWGILYPGLLGYSDDRDWTDWFAGSPFFLMLWGGFILTGKLVWIWSNVTFGLRFSNLTHRGILTGGPFRYTKHPSYLSKNITWWLIALPFLSEEGWRDALPDCIALLCVNAIYFARAKIEERHLMADPVYAEYAAWIEREGIFARLGRLLASGVPRAASRQR